VTTTWGRSPSSVGSARRAAPAPRVRPRRRRHVASRCADRPRRRWPGRARPAGSAPSAGSQRPPDPAIPPAHSPGRSPGSAAHRRVSGVSLGDPVAGQHIGRGVDPGPRLTPRHPRHRPHQPDRRPITLCRGHAPRIDFGHDSTASLVPKPRYVSMSGSRECGGYGGVGVRVNRGVAVPVPAVLRCHGRRPGLRPAPVSAASRPFRRYDG
jgi:hypothetical protein